MACDCNSRGEEEAERNTSLPAVEAMEPVWVSIVLYLDAESLSLSLDVGSPGLDGSLAEGPYEQTKLTEQGR